MAIEGNNRQLAGLYHRFDHAAGAGTCGNGLLDASEDCDWNGNQDNLTLFRPGRSTFSTWTRGA